MNADEKNNGQRKHENEGDENETKGNDTGRLVSIEIKLREEYSNFL